MGRINKVFVIITWAYITRSSTPGVYSKPANFKRPTSARLSLADWESYNLRDIDGSPGTYAFGYDVDDPETGNTQYRDEQRYPNGTVVGSYGYLDARGLPVQVRYIADENGYRIITNDRNKNTWNSNRENTENNRIESQIMNQRRPSTRTPPRGSSPYHNQYSGMLVNPQNHNDYNMNISPIMHTQHRADVINSGYDISESQFGKRGDFNIATKHRMATPESKNPNIRQKNIHNNVLYTPFYNIPA